MKLTKFKAKETDKKRIIISTGVILIIALVLVVFSYSLYQNVDEVQFVNGTVGTFKQLALKEITATSTQTSIDLSYIVEGIGVNTTCKYGLEEGTYDKEATNVTNTNCNIEELNADILYYYQVCATNSGGEVCKEGNIKTKPETDPISIVKVGDYISMTPTSTSYTPSSADTGCMNDSNCTQNTINPSELNLWRVIKKNDDGTVDVVSEYVSSTQVYFRGQMGYMNLVGGLNTIAAQYTNEKYVSKTRHIGYSNQIEKCTGTLKFNDFSVCPADTGYEKDTNLVQTAIETLKAKNPSGTETEYLLASRYDLADNTLVIYGIRYVNEYDSVSYDHLFHMNSRGEFTDYSSYYAIRPILTLKADVEIVSGDGQSEDTAYQLD